MSIPYCHRNSFACLAFVSLLGCSGVKEPSNNSIQSVIGADVVGDVAYRGLSRDKSNINMSNAVGPSASAADSQKSEQYFPVIHSGGHSSYVQGVLFTPDSAKLISFSNDKSVRIWDTNSGELLQTLFGQIGHGMRGSLSAGALSPDGNILAVASRYGGRGRGQRGKDGPSIIRLVNLQSELPKIDRILAGHQDVITSLAFSPDGRTLVSGSLDKSVRVWQVDGGQLVHTLNNQLSDVFAIAYSPDGERVVAGDRDGSLYMWNVKQGKLLTKLNGHQGFVEAVVFTPDGRYLLSGGEDQTIRLWDGVSGRFIKKLAIPYPKEEFSLSAMMPPEPGASNEEMAAWLEKIEEQPPENTLDNSVASLSVTPDGTRVLTGVGAGSGFDPSVFEIPSGKPLLRFKGHVGSVWATAISPDGKWAATGGMEKAEIKIWDISSGKVSHNLIDDGTQIMTVQFSATGEHVAFQRSGRVAPQYSLNIFDDHQLDLKSSIQPLPVEQQNSFREYMKLETALWDGCGQSEDGRFGLSHALGRPGEYMASVLRVENTRICFANADPLPATLQIVRNGVVRHRIERNPSNGGYHRTFTLTPDGKTLISGGANGTLTSYAVDSGSKEHEFIGHAGEIRSVSSSPDGRYLVSGSDDQTIRIWSVSTGHLLLTIFPAINGEWVAWTPEGFFMASPNGAKYIGYYINRGEDRLADYVGVDQLYDVYYRPDLIARKLEGEDISRYAEAIDVQRILSDGLAPRIVLFSAGNPDQSKRNTILRYQVCDAGGGIGNVLVRLNGALVALNDKGGVSIKPGSGECREMEQGVSLPGGKTTLSITAYNARNSIESRPVEQELRYDGPVPTPDLHILALAVDDYDEERLRLRYAVNDSNGLTKMLRERGGLFGDVHIHTLLDQQASAQQIAAKFDELSRTVKPSDVFVLALAGHGVSSQLDGNYHFLLPGFQLNGESIAQFGSRGLSRIESGASFNDLVGDQNTLSNDFFQRNLARIPAVNSLTLIDTCSAGAFAKVGSGNMETLTATNRFARATGRATLMASTPGEVALEGYEGHGAFTWTLLDALKGAGYGNDNTITVKELAGHVETALPELTSRIFKHQQIPQTMLQGLDFSIGAK